MRPTFTRASNAMHYTATLIVGLLLATEAAFPKAGEPARGGEAWGKITNQFCAGVFWETMDLGTGTFQEVKVAVQTSKTNVGWGYFLPPGRKLAKAELRDARGGIVIHREGKKLDDDLPETVLTKDLPQVPRVGHNGGTPANPLILAPNLPTGITNFSVQDVYPIEKEGDYTFTFQVAIYRFAPGKKSVMRIDLPSVSVRIHLTQSRT